MNTNINPNNYFKLIRDGSPYGDVIEESFQKPDGTVIVSHHVIFYRCIIDGEMVCVADQLGESGEASEMAKGLTADYNQPVCFNGSIDVFTMKEVSGDLKVYDVSLEMVNKAINDAARDSLQRGMKNAGQENATANIQDFYITSNVVHERGKERQPGFMYSEQENHSTRPKKKHEKFEEILSNAHPHDSYEPGDRIVLDVTFDDAKYLYCYLTKDDVYSPGDIVKVRTYQGEKMVTVEKVDYYSADEYPFDECPLSYIIGPAEDDLAEKYRQHKKKIEAERAEAEEMRSDAQRQHLEMQEIVKAAEEEKAKAEKATISAIQARKEAEQAGEEARNARIAQEAAEREACKTWKHTKPKTDNEFVNKLRSVQLALDEDEDIYLRLDELEDRIMKVTDKADTVDEPENSSLNRMVESLYDIYLPKTMKMLEQYKTIFTTGLTFEEYARTRTEMLSAIDYSKQAYNTILEALFEKDIEKLNIDMETLKMQIAMNGLLDSDFDIE